MLLLPRGEIIKADETMKLLAAVRSLEFRYSVYMAIYFSTP